MVTFREYMHICTIYILLNLVSNQYAFSLFNFGQVQVQRKVPPQQEHNSHSNKDSPINKPPLAMDKFQKNHQYNRNQMVQHPRPVNNLQNQPSNDRIRQPLNSAKHLPDTAHQRIANPPHFYDPEYEDSNVHADTESYEDDKSCNIDYVQNGEVNNKQLRNSARHYVRYIHKLQEPNFLAQADLPHLNDEADVQVGKQNYIPQMQGPGNGLARQIHKLRVNPLRYFVPARRFQPDYRAGFDDNLIPRRGPINHGIYQPQIHKADFKDRISHRLKDEPRMQQRTAYGGQRQTFKHFRYSRIRRYYTLSTASMTTWKKINYTVRLMYTSPTRPTTTTIRYTYTDPFLGGSSRQTVLHTRMTESDEVGRDRFMSGSIEYKDDSFDKPPTSMVDYDSQLVSANTSLSKISATATPPVTEPIETTKKASIELISLESSSEEKSSSSEAKEEPPSSESESNTEKLYGEYGYYRKFNNTPNPFTLITWANIGEIPEFKECNLTSAEIAFWQENASYVMDKYFPSSEYRHVITNYSEENLVRSFFYPENIDPTYLDFYKWYYKLLIDHERLRIIYNRTVLEEPDYKNLSQFTPYPIPEDLQRYYMFINQIEVEIDREKQQQEDLMKNHQEAEQNIDMILGIEAGKPTRPMAAGATLSAARRSKKEDPDISQILRMVDNNQQSDSLMREDDDSPERFLDASRFKRDVSKFEPD